MSARVGAVRVPWVLLVSLLGCTGPEAPDAALCRDVVLRLCQGPVCEAATQKLALDGGACEATLLARTGCGSDTFAFTSPTRAQVLDCRVPLVRQGISQQVKSACADVAETLSDCPELVRFFGGTP